MRLFLFAIGGTGSRVLKSLLMLSAAGVRPLDENGKPVKDLEIVPVIIDPTWRLCPSSSTRTRPTRT